MWILVYVHITHFNLKGLANNCSIVAKNILQQDESNYSYDLLDFDFFFSVQVHKFYSLDSEMRC